MCQKDNNKKKQNLSMLNVLPGQINCNQSKTILGLMTKHLLANCHIK